MTFSESLLTCSHLLLSFQTLLNCFLLKLSWIAFFETIHYYSLSEAHLYNFLWNSLLCNLLSFPLLLSLKVSCIVPFVRLSFESAFEVLFCCFLWMFSLKHFVNHSEIVFSETLKQVLLPCSLWSMIKALWETLFETFFYFGFEILLYTFLCSSFWLSLDLLSLWIFLMLLCLSSSLLLHSWDTLLCCSFWIFLLSLCLKRYLKL